MTTVSGNDVTISAVDIVGSTQGLIIRIPTANSSDTLDTASSIILAYFGVNTNDYDGDSINLKLYNDSPYIITLSPGTGITLFPTNNDTILPQASHTYLLIKTSGTTLDCYTTSNSNAPNTTGISLASGNIITGSTLNIGTEVTMSGDATINAAGTLTLANTSVVPGPYILSDITVDSKGRITNISSGQTSIKTFCINGPTSPIDITTTISYTDLTSYYTPTLDLDTYTYLNGEITILSSGTYLVSYTMQFNSNGNFGSITGTFQTRITKNGIGIDASVTQSSLQRLAGTNNACNNSKVYQVVCSVNDVLVLQYSQLNTSTTAQLTQDQTTITIERLK
jgi:hypothetical protein